MTAGALRTPHLLLLSGIGEGEKLARHNITLVAEVPGVGYNLQDQFTVPLFYDGKRTACARVFLCSLCFCADEVYSQAGSGDIRRREKLHVHG